MPKNHFSGKQKDGLFANGQGPVMGQSVKREEESKGVLGTDDGSGHDLKAGGGKSEGLLAGMPADKNFDLHSKSYAGPGSLAFKPREE